MKVLVLVLLLLPGCSWRSGSRALMVYNVAALACDWGQTRSWASKGWVTIEREKNPVLGPAPTTGEVDAYFWIAGVAMLAAWNLLPDDVLPYFAAALAVAQSRTLAINAHAIRYIDDGRRPYCGH